MSDLRKRIEERAYQLYLKRSGRNGDAHGDWIRAEREIMDEDRQKKPEQPGRKRKKGEKK